MYSQCSTFVNVLVRNFLNLLQILPIICGPQSKLTLKRKCNNENQEPSGGYATLNSGHSLNIVVSNAWKKLVANWAAQYANIAFDLPSQSKCLFNCIQLPLLLYIFIFIVKEEI